MLEQEERRSAHPIPSHRHQDSMRENNDLFQRQESVIYKQKRSFLKLWEGLDKIDSTI